MDIDLKVGEDMECSFQSKHIRLFNTSQNMTLNVSCYKTNFIRPIFYLTYYFTFNDVSYYNFSFNESFNKRLQSYYVFIIKLNLEIKFTTNSKVCKIRTS